MLMIEMASCDF